MNESEELEQLGELIYRSLTKILDCEPEWLSTCEILLEELSDSDMRLDEEQEERLTNAVHNAVKDLSQAPAESMLRMVSKLTVIRLEEGSDDGI